MVKDKEEANRAQDSYLKHITFKMSLDYLALREEVQQALDKNIAIKYIEDYVTELRRKADEG